MQQWIWRKEWSSLRAIQEEAIAAVLDAPKSDIIISAGTASGKTEAAFLPISSELVDVAHGSIRALYVGPLKALINDQFSRLDELCEALEIPVHRWHGDVASNKKKLVIKDPSGILLITPESLEAVFVHHGRRIGALFRSLAWVVIDELHAFMGTERGRQLQSLLHRLEIAVGRPIARIGLSATLGDMDLARTFLRPAEPNRVQLIRADDDGQDIRLQVRGYRWREPLAAPVGDEVAATPQDDEPNSGQPWDLAQHLFKVLRGKDNLIFANSRNSVENFADMLRRLCEGERVPVEFFPHHGSLAKDLREEVEELLKQRDRPVSVVCTSTLEMGIDIGTVSSVAQLGAPWLVSSLRQRLGRSGRRGQPATMRIYIREKEVNGNSSPVDALRAELVQTIAMVRLLLAGWCEPPELGALHLSTLVQQLLSLTAQLGGISAADAWKILCATGPFRTIASADFIQLLRALGKHDLLVQAPDGTLYAGKNGERIIEHYSFYAAFSTSEEYRLVCQSRTIGMLPLNQPLAPDMFLIFAGRRWRVLSVDSEHKIVSLTPAPAGRAPTFSGSGGKLHDRVRAEMRAVYESVDMPPFLDEGARSLLAEGRATFARLGLHDRRLVECGAQTLLFAWRGDRIIDTLLVQLSSSGLAVHRDGLALVIEKTRAEKVLQRLQDIAAAAPADPATLAALVVNKDDEKYDRFLNGPLLDADYAARHLDVHGARAAIEEVLSAEEAPA